MYAAHTATRVLAHSALDKDEGRSNSSESTRSQSRGDIALVLGRLDVLQRDISPLVASFQSLQQNQQEIFTRLSTLEQRVSQLAEPPAAQPSSQQRGDTDMDTSDLHVPRAQRARSAQGPARARRVGFDGAAREHSAPPASLGLGTRLILSGFVDPMDHVEFKQVLKDLFDDLPDVRVTTRKLFDTKVRVDFPSYEAAKLFKNKHVPLRPKYKDSPIYINWILTKEVATDSFLARVAKRFLAEKLGDQSAIKICSFGSLSTRRRPALHKKELFASARLGPSMSIGTTWLHMPMLNFLEGSPPSRWRSSWLLHDWAPSCSALPSVGFWNGAGIFGVDPLLSRARIGLVRQLADHHDIVIACEGRRQVANIDQLFPHHVPYYSPDELNPNAAGGVLILIKTSFWSETFAISAPWPGRIVQLLLGDEHRNLQLLGVHLTAVPPHFSWTQLAERLYETVSAHQGPSIIIGDFNFVDSPEDSISFETGIPQGRAGHRAQWWRSFFGTFSQLNAGFSHRNLAHKVLSSLDRAYSSWRLPILQALRVDLRVLGALGSLSSSSSPTPPCSGDHWPISLRWQAESHADAIPSWVYHHPSWPIATEIAFSESGPPPSNWKARLFFVEGVVSLAVKYLRDWHSQSPACSLEQIHHLALKALRLCLGGSIKEAHRVSLLLPGFPERCLPTSMARRLTLLIERTWNKILEARTKEEEIQQRTQWSSSSRDASSWYALAWKCWKKAKLVFHHPRLLDAEGVAAMSIEEEVDWLRSHWSLELNQPEPALAVDRNSLDEFIVPLPWDGVSFSREDFLGAFDSLPSTHPGDDVRPYIAYLPLREFIADSFVVMVDSMREGDALPPDWYSALMVFKPKTREPGLRVQQWRPISMLPCLSKLLARAVSFRVSRMLSVHLHCSQHGCLSGRGVPSALAEIEYSALALGSHSREAMLVLLDIKSAFSSISQSWLAKVSDSLRLQGLSIELFPCFASPI